MHCSPLPVTMVTRVWGVVRDSCRRGRWSKKRPLCGARAGEVGLWGVINTSCSHIMSPGHVGTWGGTWNHTLTYNTTFECSIGQSFKYHEDLDINGYPKIHCQKNQLTFTRHDIPASSFIDQYQTLGCGPKVDRSEKENVHLLFNVWLLTSLFEG